MYTVEIEDDQVKICAAELKENKFLLSKLIILNRPIQSEGLKVLGKIFLKSTSAVTVSIPRRKISIHYPSFPSQQNDEVKQMARYQALRQFPYRDINILHCVNILNKEPNGYTKVMLAVIGEEVLRRYLSGLKDYLLPNMVTVNSSGILGFYTKIRPNKDAIVIDLDTRFSNLCIIGEGRMLFCREIKKGFDFIRDHGIQPWLDEVLNSVASFNKEKIYKNIDSLAIVGPKYIKFLEKDRALIAFNEVEFLPQEDFVSKSNDFEYYGTSNEELFSLVKLIGLSSIEKAEIDLTPPNLIDEISRKKTLQRRKATTLYLSLAFLGLLLLFSWEYKRKAIYLSRIQYFLNDIKSEVGLLESQKRINVFFAKRVGESCFLDIFEKLTQILPRDVLLLSLDYKRDLELIIEGNSKNLEAVYDFYERVKALSFTKSINSFKVNLSSAGENVFYLKIVLK